MRIAPNIAFFRIFGKHKWHLQSHVVCIKPSPLARLYCQIKSELLQLTNWSQETFFDTANRFDFLSWFRGIVVSGAEKLIKPDPRIFQLLLDRYGLAAEHVVYIDDSPSNVEAAAALSMRGIHFVCADTLSAELANLGLLPNRTGKVPSSESNMS